MKKMIAFMGCMLILLLPFVVFAAIQSNRMDNKTTWYGGPSGDNPGKVDGATLPEIIKKALQEAAMYGRPVEYKTEDGKTIFQAFPDYGRSKCDFVHGKTWDDGKLIESKSVEVCNRNYEEVTPYVPRLRAVPRVR